MTPDRRLRAYRDKVPKPPRPALATINRHRDRRSIINAAQSPSTIAFAPAVQYISCWPPRPIGVQPPAIADAGHGERYRRHRNSVGDMLRPVEMAKPPMRHVLAAHASQAEWPAGRAAISPSPSKSASQQRCCRRRADMKALGSISSISACRQRSQRHVAQLKWPVMKMAVYNKVTPSSA